MGVFGEIKQKKTNMWTYYSKEMCLNCHENNVTKQQLQQK